MNNNCETYCRALPRLNAKELKQRLLGVFRQFGIEINGNVGCEAPRWAHEILADSIAVGPGTRFTAVAYYFADLCDRLSQLDDGQKRQIETDVSPIRNESFLAMAHNGREICISLAKMQSSRAA